MGKVANLVFGEKYGDVNDPKTRWTTVGSILTRRSKEQDPDPSDVEALQRLISGGFVSVRVDAVPTGKTFDGWLSVFEPRNWENNQSDVDANDGMPVGDDADSQKPIDLSEIPF